MVSPWPQTCLLLALLILPVVFAAFCVGASRRRPARLISYLAYYLLFGFAGQWLLTAVVWPSSLGRAMLGFLLTAAPAASLTLAVTLQVGAPRAPFDTGAMVGCYLYPALVAAGVIYARLGLGG